MVLPSCQPNSGFPISIPKLPVAYPDLQMSISGRQNTIYHPPAQTGLISSRRKENYQCLLVAIKPKYEL